MILKFNTYGNEKQKQVARLWIDKHTTQILYGGSKASGKSYLGVSLIFGDAFIYPGTHYFIARSQLNDLRKFTVPSIHEVFKHWGLTEKYYNHNQQDNYFSLYNKSRVYLIDAKYIPSDPLFERFGSIQMTRGWYEEAGEADPNAVANLSATVGRWMNKDYDLTGKILMTCNPSKNFLYSDYYLKQKRGTLEPHRAYVQALPQDNKKLPLGYIEHLESILTTNQKERLLLGNWEFDDDPRTLCDYRAITDIFTNTFVDTGDFYITCDVARFGKDFTRIFVWDGWRIIGHIGLPKSSTPQTATAIKQLQNKYAIPARNVCIDEDGIGGGVVDLLPGCVGFIANHSPIYLPDENESYGTLKDQCGYYLAKIINSSKIYAGHLTGQDRTDCIEELEQLKAREIDTDMKNRIVSKDEMKKALPQGRSPDYLDNMLMRGYLELLNRTRRTKGIITR